VVEREGERIELKERNAGNYLPDGEDPEGLEEQKGNELEDVNVDRVGVNHVDAR